jgi:hypothetical protein
MSRCRLAALGIAALASACGGRLDFELPPIDAAPDATPLPRTPVLVASPPPGIFAAPPMVTFTVDDPDQRLGGPIDLWYTLDGSPPVIGTSMHGQPGAPLALDRSRGVRLVATDEHGLVRFTFVGAYLVADGTVATFSSNLPVLVLWGEAAAPDSRNPTFTPSTLSVFAPAAGGRTSWPGPTTDGVRAGIKIRASSTAG